jgi:hypothetical protein
VTFVTLHVPGSNNNLGRSPEGDTEFAERNKANMTWLQQAFAHAKTNNSRAVMVMQQANMFPEMPPFPDLRMARGRSWQTASAGLPVWRASRA